MADNGSTPDYGKLIEDMDAKSQEDLAKAKEQVVDATETDRITADHVEHSHEHRTLNPEWDKFNKPDDKGEEKGDEPETPDDPDSPTSEFSTEVEPPNYEMPDPKGPDFINEAEPPTYEMPNPEASDWQNEHNQPGYELPEEDLDNCR